MMNDSKSSVYSKERAVRIDGVVKDIGSTLSRFRESLNSGSWWKQKSVEHDFDSLLDMVIEVESANKNNEMIIEEELYFVIDECDKLGVQVAEVIDVNERKFLLNGFRYGVVGGHPSYVSRIEATLHTLGCSAPAKHADVHKATPTLSEFTSMFAEMDMLVVYTAYNSHSMTGLAGSLARNLKRDDWLLHVNRTDNQDIVISRILSMRKRQLERLGKSM